MVDLKSILATHQSRNKPDQSSQEVPKEAGHCCIPDMIFDEILVDIKLGRVDILVLLYLYRSVWGWPNADKIYGVCPLLSHEKVEEALKIGHVELIEALNKLESMGLIEKTGRFGQYFVRRYLLEKFDQQWGQSYDTFRST